MKKNNSKRLLALMLSAIMVITLLPTTAFAAEEYALETNSYDMYASNTDAYVPNADGYDAYTPDGGTYYPQEIEEIATKDLNFSACATEICEGCGQCVPCDGHASFRWEKFNAYGYFISSPQRIIQYGNEYVRPPNPSLYVGGTIRAWARIYTYGPIPVNNPQLGQYGYAYRGPALSSSVNPFLVEIISAEMFDANENLINRCPEELGWVIRDHNSIRVSFGRQISEIPVGYRFNHGIPGFPWTTMEVYVMTACGEIESLRLTNNFYPCDCDFYYCCEYCQWIVCDFCIYCGECKNCSECLKFNWDIFNNGPLGAESRPNAGLEAINTIRLWTQIDGVNTRIPYPMNITAVIQGTDTCAMEFVRISRVWQDGTGWLNYVNLIDVRKYNEWEFIELTIIPFGCHDPVPVLLHNGNFTPQQYHTVTFVVQPGAPGAYVAQTTTVIVLDGQTIPVEAIPTYGPARTGFYFAGWYLGVSPDWVAQHPDSYGNVYGDRIFTARFNNLNHQVIFEAGSGGELEFIAPWFNPITIRDGMLFWAERVPTPVPNSGYRFLRWEFDGVEVNPAGFQVVNPHPRTLNDYLREEMTLTFTAVFEQITFTLTPDEVTICNGSTFCSPACVLDNRHVPVYIGGNATGAITFTNPDPELITIIENQGLWTPAGPAHGIVVGVRGGVTLTEPRTFEVEVTREGVMQVVTIHLVPCAPPLQTSIQFNANGGTFIPAFGTHDWHMDRGSLNVGGDVYYFYYYDYSNWGTTYFLLYHVINGGTWVERYGYVFLGWGTGPDVADRITYPNGRLLDGVASTAVMSGDVFYAIWEEYVPASQTYVQFNANGGIFVPAFGDSQWHMDHGRLNVAGDVYYFHNYSVWTTEGIFYHVINGGIWVERYDYVFLGWGIGPDVADLITYPNGMLLDGVIPVAVMSGQAFYAIWEAVQQQNQYRLEITVNLNAQYVGRHGDTVLFFDNAGNSLEFVRVSTTPLVYALVTDAPFVGTVRVVTAPSAGYAIPWFVANTVNVAANDYDVNRFAEASVKLYLWGAVRGETYVAVYDLNLLMTFLMDSTIEINYAAANVTSSGTIDINDFLLLQAFLLGQNVGPRAPATP